LIFIQQPENQSAKIMNWKVLTTEDDYQKASIRMMAIFHSKPGSTESEELELLIRLIKDYDVRHHQIPNKA
jgi:HTH-type transcriptional regulator/antitoxin HigA